MAANKEVLPTASVAGAERRSRIPAHAGRCMHALRVERWTQDRLEEVMWRAEGWTI